VSDSHNVFISHRHEDDHLLGKLKELLSARGCDVRDSSVNSATPNNAKAEDYIKSILADRIKWAGKIVVIISPDTKNHEWVDWEIEYANKFPDKRIIGVWAPGTVQGDMPDPLADYADAIVSWDADAISSALNGHDNWQSPEGSAGPERVISRIGC
jgi:hypothetical protein